MFLLDTNTVVYFFKGKGRVRERLSAVRPADVAISAVSLYELDVGIAKSDQPARLGNQLDTFVAAVSVLPFDQPVARTAAEVRADLERRGIPIGVLDNLIAGTALSHRATLVTRNTKEFSRLSNLSIVDWYD
jgi:tRNA(fMet)-specific endonuclease VapC